MKLWCLACALAGFAGGYMAHAPTGPAKVINWLPSERYQMEIDPWGRAWRLDKATGTIHVVSGNLSFDVPEYRIE
jgi:hypothetical protein